MEETEGRPRLVLVPGLGVSGALYARQQGIPARVEVAEWVGPGSGETVESYGQRMAGRVAGGGPVYLGGVSFGGLVALEMAKHLDCRGVFLIASARSRREIPWYFRPGVAVIRATPKPLVRLTRWMSPLVIRAAGRFDRRDRELAVRVIRQMDIDIGRWSLGAMVKWKAELPAGVPIHQIHGTHDWILPPSWIGRATWVRGGGHLMNIDRAAEVNWFIAERLRRDASGAWRPTARLANRP